MSHSSPAGLLVLHATRILGFADTPAIARRFNLDLGVTGQALLDAQAHGRVQRAEFADLRGWSLTDAGRSRNENELRDELAATGKTDQIWNIHRDFHPLNGRLQRACTDWQLRPTPGAALAENDHTDTAWDERILGELTFISTALGLLADQLSSVLPRFDGYDTRFATALHRARAGGQRWVDRSDVDSCHRVWFELHEDLVATLGIDRRAESTQDDPPSGM